MPYEDAVLEKLLLDLEADNVERKETWQGDAPDKGRQAVCAFANDLPNQDKEGVLFVGANDGGKPIGLKVDDRLLQTLSDMKTDGQIVPPPSITVQKRRLLGTDLAVIHVRPSDSPPVRYGGRIWIRVGPRRGIATVQEERILSEKRLHGDKPFDVRPCRGATIKDLDLRFFENSYLSAAFSIDVLEANERSPSERLRALKMVTGADETATNLGILVLSESGRDFIAGNYAQFLRIQGTSLSDPIQDAAEIIGRVDEIIRRTEDKMIAHNRVRVDITSGPLEIRSAEYPIGALQQLVRNAVMHRTYEQSNAPTRITWFDDRIEIQNPGGPYGAVSADNFGQAGITDYRNPSLSEAMRVLGFVQRFGVGIATARDQLAKNGNPPVEFRVTSSFVTAIVRPDS